MGGPFTLQFANHFIFYQKRPFRGRFGTGRLHSELWAWGVKRNQISTPNFIYQNDQRNKMKTLGDYGNESPTHSGAAHAISKK